MKYLLIFLVSLVAPVPAFALSDIDDHSNQAGR